MTCINTGKSVSLKKANLSSFVTTEMKLEEIMLSKICQAKINNDKCRKISLICEFLKVKLLYEEWNGDCQELEREGWTRC